MLIAPYAALLALFFLYLSVRIILLRHRARIAMGDGGDARLSVWIRAHGNFSEYTPFALILLFILETGHYAPDWTLHALAGAFLAGRLCHAYALTHSEGPTAKLWARGAGMLSTFVVMGLSALILLWQTARLF